ncbi:MAG: cytochrome c biogenesis protein ResB, partial [Verrucomicrobiota bacterium]
LTLWGTLYQKYNGLYAAKKKFFDSYVIWINDSIPFPGTSLILWIFFINLFLSMMLHFKYGLRHIGLVILHAGLLLMLAGGFVTQEYGEESHLTLMEGMTSNVAASYHDWEISVWQGNDSLKDVMAFDSDHLETGDRLTWDEAGFSLAVQKYHINSRAFTSREPSAPTDILNASGVNQIEWAKRERDPERHLPSGLFTIEDQSGTQQKLILFGGDERSTEITVNEEAWNIQLRRKRYPLPLSVKLVDFRREMHPNSSVAKEYSSKVSVSMNEIDRDVLISMNNPFRYKGLTFFQASFQETGGGPEISTFAVTKNYGRLIPYVATGIVFIGMLIHFV